MSVRAMTWVMYESETTGNDRLVLLAIADEADDEGLNAWPGTERIALKARVNRATVTRALARLEAAGELLILRPERQGRGHFNRYALALGRSLDETAADAGWRFEGSQSAPHLVVDKPQRRGATRSPSADKKGAKGAHGGGERVAPERERVAPGASVPHDPMTQDPRRRNGRPVDFAGSPPAHLSEHPIYKKQRLEEEARLRGEAS